MVAPHYVNLEIHPALTDEDKQKCIDIHLKVFINEQKFPLEIHTKDEYKESAYYWLATCEMAGSKERIPVGTIRLIPKKNGVAQLGRMAVLSDARGLSLGRKLILAFVEGAKQLGLTSSFLVGQADKRIFYEKCGFAVEKNDEEPYPVFGVPHYTMWMRSFS